jgi:glycosyltransferase involved in cell wall biosynthesis
MSEPDLPSVSVVVPTFRRRDLLPRVLLPLLDDKHAAEIIVVVDGARDGSIEYLERLARDHPRLRPMFLSHRGQSRARDAAAEAATSEVLLFLDDDVLAGPCLAAGHARHHAAVGSLVVLGWVPVPIPVRTSPSYTVELFAEWYKHQAADFERHPDRILFNVWGGHLSIRRSDWAQVRFRSESFDNPYNEDQDFGLRCLRAGLTGVFDRSLKAEHLYTRSFEQFMRDAEASGEGRWLIHHLHADLVGPLPEDAFEQGLPRVARRAIRLARRPRAFAGLDLAGRAGLRIAGALRLRPWERRFARVLVRLRQQAASLACRAH